MADSLPYSKTILPNGTQLVLVPMQGVESMATSVMVGVGSRYETPAINGISHFLEHMVFKGTKQFPTTDDVNFIERLGGLQNAYTDIDITNYHNKVLAVDWKEALGINKELAMMPLLEQKHVDKERDVILEEMKRYEDEPAAKVSEAFHTMMYPGTKLGMRIIGEEAPLKSATAQTLREYHDAWYVPGKTVVVMAGAMDGARQKEITEQVNEWFSPLPAKKVGSTEPVVDMQTESALSVVTKPDAQQAHLTLGLRIFPRGSEDRFAWSVFNLLFGISFTSRLFKEIREKQGLCYHIRSSADTWEDVGYWSIYAGVATEKVHQAVEGIMTELKKALDSGITEEEIAVSKKRLMTLMAFRSEDPEFMNEWYGRQVLYGLPVLTLAQHLEKIQQVTRKDIEGCIKKYFVPHNVNLALVWNKPNDERLRGLLTLQ